MIKFIEDKFVDRAVIKKRCRLTGPPNRQIRRLIKPKLRKQTCNEATSGQVSIKDSKKGSKRGSIVSEKGTKKTVNKRGRKRQKNNKNEGITKAVSPKSFTALPPIREKKYFPKLERDKSTPIKRERKYFSGQNKSLRRTKTSKMDTKIGLKSISQPGIIIKKPKKTK